MVGRPATPEDLARWPCVGLRTGNDRLIPWELGNAPELRIIQADRPFCANGTKLAVEVATSGVALMYGLEIRITAVVAEGKLEIVLPESASIGPPLSRYYPSRRQLQPGLREPIDLVRRRSNEKAAAKTT